MFLNEENLSVQHDLTFQLERAFEENTLENFIMDFLGFGTGTIEDIYTATSTSSIIESSDIDKALNYLKSNGLLTEEKNPYDDLVEKYNEVKDCEDDNVIFEEVNQLYFPNMGNKNWDDAYEAFISNYESGKLEESLNENRLLEYFKNSRLTNVAKILDKTSNEDELRRKSDYYKQVAKKLWPVNIAARKNWKNILVYEAGDKAITSYFTGAHEGIFKKIKGWTYGKVGDKLYLYFANLGAFDQVNNALDNLEVTSADETDVAAATTDTSVGVDTTKPKTITVKKKDNGTYYVEVPVLGTLLDDARYDSKEAAVKGVFATLKKYKLNPNDFKEKIKYDFVEDETGATVTRDPDTREVTAYKGVGIAKCLFIVDGNVYNYTAYKKLPEKKRQRVVVIDNSTGVLLNRNSDSIITEALNDGVELNTFMNQLDESTRKEIKIVHHSLKESTPSTWIDYDEEEEELDSLYHDASEDELRKMGAFDNLDDEDNDPWLDEAYDNDVEVDCMTIEDLIEGLSGNATEEEIDRQFKLFRKIGKLLEVPNYDKVVVAVDDGEYDPQYIFSDGLLIPNFGSEVTHYPEAKMVAEKLNGQIFLYFRNEEDCKNYYQLANKFLNDFDLDENPFNDYDDKHAAEWMERNPHGYYNDESDYGTDVDVVDIEEALNLRDKHNYNKYDLLNSYLSERFTLDQRKVLATMLKENKSDKEIYNYLTENKTIDNEFSFKGIF